MIIPGGYQNDSLQIKIVETGEVLEIDSWFTGGPFPIENFRFSNGTELTGEQVSQLAFDRGIQGTDGSDTLWGIPYGVNFYAKGGNDTVYGGEGDDTVWGGAGNDYISDSGAGDNVIYGEDGDDGIWTSGNGNNYLSGGMGVDNLRGGSGNDTLDSGSGNEYIYGSAGDDTYVYYRGSGNDKISDDSGANDAVRFDGLIQSDLDLMVSSFQNDDGITARIKDTGEILHLMNWFTNDQYKN